MTKLECISVFLCFMNFVLIILHWRLVKLCAVQFTAIIDLIDRVRFLEAWVLGHIDGHQDAGDSHGIIRLAEDVVDPA